MQLSAYKYCSLPWHPNLKGSFHILKTRVDNPQPLCWDYQIGNTASHVRGGKGCLLFGNWSKMHHLISLRPPNIPIRQCLSVTGLDLNQQPHSVSHFQFLKHQFSFIRIKNSTLLPPLPSDSDCEGKISTQDSPLLSNCSEWPASRRYSSWKSGPAGTSNNSEPLSC